MILTGRVIDQDGRPLPNVKVHVYHTDAQGRYQLPGKDGFRLTGDVWTNGKGRFEFRTIRPGPYPGATTGEHFHLKLTEGGIPDHFASIEFFDDREVKLPVAVGKQGGSATYYTQFGWKPDPQINGQRVEVDLKVEK
jgi:protocatechuate 3,4-dioxygenase beta subunit